MQSSPSFDDVIAEIRAEDPQFERGAYYFVRHGLDFTIRELKQKKPNRGDNHVSGQELLEGIREFALEQYGPLALTLLNHWGVRQCEDFGKIVFQLVERQVLGKTERDSQEDFEGGYDFEDAFVRPFLPNSKRDLQHN
ncbi:MAG: Minf_1886 family protein [Opitutales bacterium]